MRAGLPAVCAAGDCRITGLAISIALPSLPAPAPAQGGRIPPSRCLLRQYLLFICLQVIGNKYESFTAMLIEGQEASVALDELGLKRYCCRRHLLTHVDLIDKLLSFHTFHRKDEGFKR
jgi:DNA-directed RNA polymerase subunit N (RpoN/RPB10)